MTRVGKAVALCIPGPMQKRVSEEEEAKNGNLQQTRIALSRMTLIKLGLALFRGAQKGSQKRRGGGKHSGITRNTRIARLRATFVCIN